MAYAIKAAIAEPVEGELVFPAQKTMYGGKKIGVGDAIYLFASENDGGRGLVARGIVTEAAPLQGCRVSSGRRRWSASRSGPLRWRRVRSGATS